MAKQDDTSSTRPTDATAVAGRTKSITQNPAGAAPSENSLDITGLDIDQRREPTATNRITPATGRRHNGAARPARGRPARSREPAGIRRASDLAATAEAEGGAPRTEPVEQRRMREQSSTHADRSAAAPSAPSEPPPADGKIAPRNSGVVVPEGIHKRFIQVGRHYHFADGAHAFTVRSNRLVTRSENTEV